MNHKIGNNLFQHFTAVSQLMFNQSSIFIISKYMSMTMAPTIAKAVPAMMLKITGMAHGR